MSLHNPHTVRHRPDVGAADYLVALYLLLVAALDPTLWWTIPNYVFGAALVVLALRVAQTGLISEAVLRDPVVWMAAALVAWLYTCAFMSPHPTQARIATEYQAKVLLIGVVVLAGVSRVPRLKLWLAAFVLGAAGLAWGTVATTFEAGLLEGIRSTGLARQENALGQAMVSGLAAAVLLMPLVRRPARRLVVLQIAALLLTLLISGSRGAAISAITMLLTYVVLEQLPRLRRYSLRLAIAAMVGFVLLGIAGSILSNAPVVARLQAMLDSGLSSITGDARWEIYTHSWGLFLQNMTFGVGLGNYQFYNPAYVYTHTTFLELLVGGGIIAGFLYYLIVAVAFVRCCRAARRHKANVPYRVFFHAAAAVVVGIAVQGAFSLAFQSKHFTILLFLVAGAARASRSWGDMIPAEGSNHWHVTSASVEERIEPLSV